MTEEIINTDDYFYEITDESIRRSSFRAKRNRY